ncbi:MAG: class I SAM-dependent methyltransferase [Candidatus Tectomicrobia bacterium]|nr:class I SAM-dependent methyltransferase [Candidatus Tectomicrobia bacterium]
MEQAGRRADLLRLVATRQGYDLGYLGDISFGGWRLQRDTCQFLGRYCEEVRPKRVLEFGSGVSTRILAHEAARGHVQQVWSIDHLPDFPGHPRFGLAAQGLQQFVQFVTCPIRLRYVAGKVFQHYALSRAFLKQLGRLDLVLIDGPPYFFNSREPALYLLFEHLAPGSLVLLDDANRRQREQRYLRNWQAYFGPAVETLLLLDEFKKGLALTWRTEAAPWPRRFPPRERLAESWLSLHKEFQRLRGGIMRRLRPQGC